MRLDRNTHQRIQLPFQSLTSEDQLSDLPNLYVLAILYALQSGEHRLHILYLSHNILAGLWRIEETTIPKQSEQTSAPTVMAAVCFGCFTAHALAASIRSRIFHCKESFLTKDFTLSLVSCSHLVLASFARFIFFFIPLVV